MEVKDLNNVATIQAMFVKAATSVVGGQMLGEGFASLVNGASEVLAVKPELQSKEVNEDRNVVRSQQNEVPARSDKNNMKGTKKSVSSSEKKQEVVVDKKKVKSEEKVVENNYTADVSVAAQNAYNAIEKGADVVIDENGAVILSQGFDINEVNPADIFWVFDASSGEMMQMGGAELKSMLQQAELDNNLFVIGGFAESEALIKNISLENIVEQERRFKGEQDSSLQIGGQENEDALLTEQAKILDEKLGKDQKLEVKVNISEENFSYVDKKELIKEQVIFEEATAKVLKDINGVGNNSNVNNIALGLAVDNQQNQNTQQVDLKNVMPVTNVGIASADLIKTASVDANVGLNSGNSSALSGVGTILDAKSDAGIKMFDNNSRDVFKGMSKEVVEQVKVNITKSAVKGVDKIDIRLKPEELGNIEIKMQISKDGKLQAHIVASRQETIDILQREMQDLEKAFNEAGFETDSGSFSFSFRGENEDEQNAKLRSFIGDVLEKDAAELSVDNDNLVEWSSAQGLNIKV